MAAKITTPVAKLKSTKPVAPTLKEQGKAIAETMTAKPAKKKSYPPTGCAECDHHLATGGVYTDYVITNCGIYHTSRKQEEAAKIDPASQPCYCESMTKSFQGGVYGYKPENAKRLAEDVCPRHKFGKVERRAERQNPGEPSCEVLPVRDTNGLSRVSVPCGPCPVKLTDGKWATLRVWVEAVRAHFEAKEKRFLTVLGVAYWLDDALPITDHDRLIKLQRRVAKLCPAEWAHEMKRATAQQEHDASSVAVVPVTLPTGESVTVATHDSGAKVTKAKPGVCKCIIEALEAASKDKPVTKEQILEVLVKTFPERTREAMKNTIGGYVPSGIKAEKKRQCENDGKGGFWLPK